MGKNIILFSGAILGFISVALGAYTSHGLRAQLTPEKLDAMLTALKYHQAHSILICAIGLALLSNPKLAKISTLHWSAGAFILGILLFSFSIYISTLFNLPQINKATPIGGLTLMLAWLLLAYAGMRATN